MSTEQKDFQEWLERAAKGSGAKIQQSAMYAGIVTDAFLKDPLCALQLGYAILNDKPIMLIVEKSCKIPEGLTKVARVIERVDTKNPEDMKRASESIQMMARGIR